MKLQLKYRKDLKRLPKAALIQSTTPIDWLQTIDQWNIDWRALECYLLPVSKGRIDASALLVIFKNGVPPKELGNAIPYGLVGNKLLLPNESVLFPEVGESELSGLLNFHWQLFHPTIGLVGFQKEDELNLVDLLHLNAPIERDWSFAKKGNPTLPKLRRIGIVASEDPLQALSEGIEKKPLEDIPGMEEADPDNLMDKLKSAALKKGLSLSDSLGGSAGGGLLGQLGNWAKQQLSDIEERQKQELDRLMDLFDKNQEEALKYALPLDDSYQGRGQAPPSYKLLRRNTDFKLGGLGGGGRISFWNAGDKYYKLRQKYQKAAAELIKQGKYRKAAYIYAHLLKDFHSAANTLKRGKYYREAAVLYKKHLNNIPQAAQCLEEGGLIFEAIELYLELDRKEKVGDLYTKVGQYDKANEFYQFVTDVAVINRDFLEAARLYEHKMRRPEAAQKVLLDGWEYPSNQSESCLKNYFDITLRTGSGQINEQVKTIYQNHTSDTKKVNFLNALTYVRAKYSEDEFKKDSEEIAYELISELSTNGQYHHLSTLKKFVPEDRLILSDTQRYINRQPKRQYRNNKKYSLIKTIHLPHGIKWEAAASRLNQFVAVGNKEGYVNVVRGDWEGSIDTKTWHDGNRSFDPIEFLDPLYTTNGNFFVTGGATNKPLILPRNQFCNTKTILENLDWLPSSAYAVAYSNDTKSIIAIVENKGELSINSYSTDGKLYHTTSCMLAKDPDLPFYDFDYREKSKMIVRKGICYLHNGIDKLLEISPQGIVTTHPVEGKPRLFKSSPLHTTTRVLMSTDKGVYFFKAYPGKLHMVGGAFSPFFFPSDMTFLNNGKIILVQGKQVEVYDSQHKTQEPTKLDEFETPYPVQAILPIPRRHQFAFLTQNGKILIYKMQE